MALPTHRRLRQTADINRVYNRGSRGNGSGLFVRVLRNNSTDSRAVVVVGKKISKKAVVRNKIRRQLTDQLQTLWPKFAAPLDLVVYVRDDLSQTPVATVAAELKKALSQAQATPKD